MKSKLAALTLAALMGLGGFTVSAESGPSGGDYGGGSTVYGPYSIVDCKNGFQGATSATYGAGNQVLIGKDNKKMMA